MIQFYNLIDKIELLKAEIQAKVLWYNEKTYDEKGICNCRDKTSMSYISLTNDNGHKISSNFNVCK